MNREKVIEYLKQKKINPLILLNPSSNLLSDITDYALVWRTNREYAINDDSKDDIYLGQTIRIDEKGNVKFLLEPTKEKKPEVHTRTIKTYTITDDDKYIEEAHVKSTNVEYNLTLEEMRARKVPTFKVDVSMLQHIYDTNGIEWERNDKNFVIEGKNYSEAVDLVQNEKYKKSEDYEIEACNWICTKTKRNYEIGSARIEQKTKYRDIPEYGVNVKLKGEHIQTLEIDIDSENELDNICNLYKNAKDFTSIIRQNKKLNFDYHNLPKEEREQYFSSIYKSIMSLRNTEIRTAMLTLFLERNFAKELGVESKLSEKEKIM